MNGIKDLKLKKISRSKARSMDFNELVKYLRNT
jgi:hypothetical protein